mgnify:CR=1 FL=1
MIKDLKNIHLFMYMIANSYCKFKTNHEKIEKILQHYGLRKIQSSLYARDLDNNERKDSCENIKNIIRECFDNANLSKKMQKRNLR